MAKAQSSVVNTPGMDSNSSKKSLQPPKSTGKQTTLLGFFQKAPTPSQTPTQKRVEARSKVLPTPLPSSELGDDVSPIRLPVRQKENEASGLRTPETPLAEKNAMEMDIDVDVDSSGLRKKRRVINYNELSDDESEEERIPKKRSRTKRKVLDDDDETDAYVPEAKGHEDEDEEEDLGSMSAEDSPPSAEASPSPEPIVRKSKSKLSKFSASTPGSFSPSTSCPTPKPSLGAFGKPLDKGERAKKFTETNKDRYSWLLDIRDKEGNRRGDENYDPRSLYIPNSAWKSFTAFERQYWEVKQNLWDTVLFFQKGKFFELYENDATIGHQEFDLKLTDRTNMRMVGVPESHFSYWAAQFVAKGYKVAKASQSENKVAKEMRQKNQTAAQSKKDDIIRRELSCVLTSGTLVDESMLHDELATYCIAVKELCPHEDADPEFGIALVDTATGEMGICQFKDDRDRTKFETLLAQLRPKEVLLERSRLTKLSTKMLKNSLPSGALWNWLHPDKEFWDEDRTESELRIANYFSEKDGSREISSWPEALQKAKESAPLALSAYGALVFYLRYLKIDTEIVTMGNVQTYDPLRKAGRMILDGKTLINLEVFENSWDKGPEGTVFRLLWRGVTPFGKRLFRQWLCHPLRFAQDINARLDASDTLNRLPEIRDQFLSTFNRLPDLERILSRIHARRCKVKDFVRVLEGFEVIMEGIEQIKETAEMQEEITSGLLKKLLSAFDGLKTLLDGWEHAFDWEKAKEEDELIPMKGVEADFDESNAKLDRILGDLENYRKGYQQKYRSNKIVFKDLGKEIFQIECPVEISVPSSWRLLSSTKAVKRYWSPEVEKKVRELLECRETHKNVVSEMQGRLYGRFDADYDKWMLVVRSVAHLDCLVSLSVFNDSGLGEPKCRPEFVEQEGIRSFVEFEELRHPCIVEGVKQDFIPNDVSLGGKVPNLVLLTGANMAGKSTLLRQTCVAVIIAQVGCYVPAQKARLTPVDRIMSRLGANDNIFASASTFMVELAETKKIISEATPNSLVILDELGRGTSTYDGVAVAHAVLHHLASHVGCIGFFATHYRNLGEEFKLHPEIGMKTMSVLVDEENREVTFLYKLIDGISEKSYGMNVAAMAGVPHDVVAKAEEAAHEFELGSRLAKSLENSGRGSEVSLALQSDFAWIGRLAIEGKAEDDDLWDVTRRLKTLLRVTDRLDA